MKTGGWAGAVGQWRGKNIDALGREQGADVLNGEIVGAVAVADEESFGIEPEHVAGFGRSWSGDCRSSPNVETLTDSGVVGGFGNAIGLAGTERDEALIGRQGCIVSIDGIECETGVRRQFDHFGAGGFEFMAKGIVLGLRSCEVGRMEESKFLPAGCVLGLAPPGGAGRADENALERSDHGVAVEMSRGKSFRHGGGFVDRFK